MARVAEQQAGVEHVEDGYPASSVKQARLMRWQCALYTLITVLRQQEGSFKSKKPIQKC
jgi:hypothetical protein